MHRPSLPAVREWAFFTVVIGSRVYRTMLLTLVVIAIAPALLSWQPYVVKSASMEPSIATGDVALGRPFSEGEKVAVGRVYMFDEPTANDDRVLVHRIVERRNDGDYVTRGDGNAVPDATPITTDHLRARGILLVPYVGLPIVWLQAGQYVHLGLWLLLTIGAFFLATRNVDGEPPKWTMWRLLREAFAKDEPDAPAPEPRVPASTSARSVRAVAATVAICLLGTTVGSANATFTSNTSNVANTFSAGHWLLPYVAAVTADNPRGFWLLDETSGTNVRDHSRTYADGRTNGAVQRGLPGAHTARNPGTSFRFNGGGGVLNPSPTNVGPRHTVELWFRTTSTQEGYLIGFEDQGISPTNYDRTVLMNNRGQIVLGDWSLAGRNMVTTPRSYNDGQWHHLVVTSVPGPIWRGPTGTVHIDGVQVAQGETTGFLTSFTGSWQIGQGRRAAGTIWWPFPVTLTFRGDIDAVAVYDRALTPAQIQAHWDAR